MHVIADAHIYDRHIPLVEELLGREPLAAPRLKLNPEIKNFYDFRVEDIQLEDYQWHKFPVKIPVAE